MTLIDGKKIAEEITARVKMRIKKTGVRPGLAVVLVGTRPDSLMYVALKERACAEVGIHFELTQFPETVSEQELLAHIDTLNCLPNIHAILVQFPLPSHIHEQTVIEHIDPRKDVDGFHPHNTTRYNDGDPTVHTPVLIKAVDALIASTKKSLSHAHAVILGNSPVFVEPLAAYLKRQQVEVTSYAPTPDMIPLETQEADILISALGRPHALTANHIKKGAILIDIGITKMPGGAVVGDIDTESLRARDVFVTPVPGGVGPVTVASLLENALELAL